ncbi:MAG: FkbM family methyltransferase [Sediminibacterium sp.]|jgi:FkbM family methyltransferase|nr:FkbM family methyltransferase [Sediminibacterium sp.]
MENVRLINVEDDVSLFGTSETDVRFLYKEIFGWKSYGDIPLPERPYIIDAGANVGIFTLYMKSLHPGAEVVAFEPVPYLAAAASANFEREGFTDVTLHPIALGAEAGQVQIRHYPLRPSGSSLSIRDQQQLKQEAEAWMSPRLAERMFRGKLATVSRNRLGDYVEPGRVIDLLKIDVVGSELDVMAGLDGSQWQLVRYVVVDLVDQDGRLRQVSEALASRGFRIEVRQSGPDQDARLSFFVHGVRDTNGKCDPSEHQDRDRPHAQRSARAPDLEQPAGTQHGR